MPEEAAIINVSKALFTITLATLGAVAGAAANVPAAGAIALVQATFASNILKPLLEKKPAEYLKLPIPPWWMGEPRAQSWQAVCLRVEDRLPIILTGVEQQLSEERRQQKVHYLSSEDIKRLFIEQVVQQLIWDVKPQDRYLVADYVTPLLLEKMADTLKAAIDATHQDAMAQWMAQVADQLNAIQQATVTLTAASMVIPASATAPPAQSSGTAQELQPTPATVELVRKQQNKAYDVYISYNRDDRAEVIAIVEKLKARGILPWLDVQEIRPGGEAMHEQEKQILTIPVAAIFSGRHGIMDEQELETHAFIKQFIKRHIPVIPVILPGAPVELELPPFLDNFFAVNFHSPAPDPMGQLIWGITGVRP